MGLISAPLAPTIPRAQDTLLSLRGRKAIPGLGHPTCGRWVGGARRGVEEEGQFLRRTGSGSVQGLIKRLGLISCVFQESSQGEQGEGRGLLKPPANFVLQLLAGERLQRAVCFGQMRSTETVVGPCWGSGGGPGQRGPCAFSTERRVFFTGGVRPQAASRNQL